MATDSPSVSGPFLCVNETDIFFEEDWGTGIGGGLWSTGKAMAEYFIAHPSLIRNNMKRLKRLDHAKGAKVLELGSGNGLLSVCLAAIAKDSISKLVATDLDDHLDLMRKTMLANGHVVNLDGKSADAGKIMVEVKELHWGKADNDFKDEKFDFIFGTDVVYRDYLHEPFIETLKTYSHSGTISLIGVTMLDTKPRFFKLLKENGFNYERLHENHMPPDFKGTTFGLFAVQMK